MIPGRSRNCRRPSWTTVPAERPTARMARAENMKAIDPPMRRPMNVLGSATLICVSKAPRNKTGAALAEFELAPDGLDKLCERGPRGDDGRADGESLGD